MTDTRFTPHDLIAYEASQTGLEVEAFGVSPTMVLSWFPAVIRSLAEAAGAEQVDTWIYGERHALYRGDVGGQPVSFAHVPVGAPGTVAMMEEMIACGARTLIGLGMAGSLQERAAVGTLLIPTSCLAEEGTSPHYLRPGTTIGPAKNLVERLTEACRAEGVEGLQGRLWTTDAPYRETVAKIEEYSHRGVLGVDMETSAMYALGAVRGVDVCNLLVVSDELLREWRPAFGTSVLRDALRLAERVILRCIGDRLST